MVLYREGFGTVYILENVAANRVKVGVTINSASERLREVNELWTGRKGTCQVCGCRRLVRRGRIPQHSSFGKQCPGSYEPPLESDSGVAEWHLRHLQQRHTQLSGTERGSVTRMMKRIETVIAHTRHAGGLVGTWELRYEVFAELAAEVESRSHGFLACRLDELAPIGEVFVCPLEDAIAAVECALHELGVAQAAEVHRYP